MPTRNFNFGLLLNFMTNQLKLIWRFNICQVFTLTKWVSMNTSSGLQSKSERCTKPSRNTVWSTTTSSRPCCLRWRWFSWRERSSTCESETNCHRTSRQSKKLQSKHRNLKTKMLWTQLGNCLTGASEIRMVEHQTHGRFNS